MQLVIVESPAKAKTIEGYLGKDYSTLSETKDALKPVIDKWSDAVAAQVTTYIKAK